MAVVMNLEVATRYGLDVMISFSTFPSAKHLLHSQTSARSPGSDICFRAIRAIAREIEPK